MDPMNVGSRIVNFIVNFIRDGTVFAITLKYTTLVCMRSIVTREPRNRDNGASDVWALTAYCLRICTDTDIKEKKQKKNEELEKGWIVNTKDFLYFESLPQLEVWSSITRVDRPFLHMLYAHHL